MIDVLSLLTKLLGGFSVPDIQARVEAWLAEKGSEYPDLRERTDALAAWLAQVLTETVPALDPVALHDTIWGIASDVIHGTAGVDYGSWQGGG